MSRAARRSGGLSVAGGAVAGGGTAQYPTAGKDVRVELAGALVAGDVSRGIAASLRAWGRHERAGSRALRV